MTGLDHPNVYDLERRPSKDPMPQGCAPKQPRRLGAIAILSVLAVLAVVSAAPAMAFHPEVGDYEGKVECCMPFGVTPHVAFTVHHVDGHWWAKDIHCGCGIYSRAEIIGLNLAGVWEMKVVNDGSYGVMRGHWADHRHVVGHGDMMLWGSLLPLDWHAHLIQP